MNIHVNAQGISRGCSHVFTECFPLVVRVLKDANVNKMLTGKKFARAAA